MRGASALHEILTGSAHDSIRVFVIWEPVLWTDGLRHAGRSLALHLPDPRARHYWDPGRSLSAEILRSPWTRSDRIPGSAYGVVWDWVAAYPRGMRWLSSFPQPVLQHFPVVDGADRIRTWVRHASLLPRQ